ncbi:MAG: antibiotic biosynthesis monooxygenase [Pyrinomonadaceae bacterium]|nr:antibiotic biosynthesis monooxygenase [Pyrinomonadaceae bacterium]
MGIISRHWKGIAKPDEEENYINHLRQDTFPKLRGINGFIEAFILRKTTDRGVEFLIVTHWQSMEAVRQFAGEAAGVAVVPLAVQAMMVEYDEEVAHYEIVGGESRSE